MTAPSVTESHTRALPQRPIATALMCALGPLALLLTTAGACSQRDAARALPSAAPAADEVAAGGLDAAIAAHWQGAGVTPVAAADDVVLLRRVSLDLLGRIPTVAELDAFVADAGADRYERVVAGMLADDEHARHLATMWTEVLIGSALKVPQPVVRGTRDYLQARLAADTGFDRITREMLTVEGDVDAESAAGFLLAHGRRGRTTALAGQSARVFLAAQIECAQCHDHPSAAFTQADFHAYAAHFARTAARPLRDGEGYRVRIVEKRRGQGRLPLPDDPPEQPSGEIVAPRYFGVDTHLGDGTRREALAAAIVADRRFALALANRTWAQLFGRGLVEPVDDIPLAGEVPALLEVLADELVAHDFALDPLIEAIVCSAAYRRGGEGEGDGEARVAAFAQAAVRPLAPEPLLRSLATAGATGEATALEDAFRRRRAALREFMFTFDDDEGKDAELGPNLPQALLWHNGQLTARVAEDAPGRSLHAILRAHDDAAPRVDALWWRFFARHPDDAEREAALARLRVADDAPEAYEDLVFALVNSSEFTTNH